VTAARFGRVRSGVADTSWPRWLATAVVCAAALVVALAALVVACVAALAAAWAGEADRATAAAGAAIAAAATATVRPAVTGRDRRRRGLFLMRLPGCVSMPSTLGSCRSAQNPAGHRT